jgi:hypothetical protein
MTERVNSGEKLLIWSRKFSGWVCLLGIIIVLGVIVVFLSATSHFCCRPHPFHFTMRMRPSFQNVPDSSSKMSAGGLMPLMHLPTVLYKWLGECFNVSLPLNISKDEVHNEILKINSVNSCDYSFRYLSVIMYWCYLFRDNVVGIATGYGMDDRGVGVGVPVGSRIFSMSSRPALGPTRPPIQWVPGTLSPGIKRQGREADHSPPTSAEVKKMWIYTSTSPYTFMA